MDRYRRGNRKKLRKMTVGFALLILFISLLTACGNQKLSLSPSDKYTGDGRDQKNSPVNLAYFGRIEESPLYGAYEKGYFKSAGIEAHLVKSLEETIEKEIQAGTVDGVTADYRFFQYIEKGLPLTIAAGLHAGCFRVIVPKGSGIRRIRDLKGLRMGVEAKGEGTMVFASMLLRSNDVDPLEQITWKYYGETGYQKAFEKGDLDAACIWEPSSRDAEALAKEFKTIYTNVEGGSSSGGHNHGSGTHFTRSFLGLSEGLMVGNPKKAAAIAKAWLLGAQWVGENPKEAAGLAVEKSYVEGSFADNLNRLNSYMWPTGVRSAKTNLKYYIKEQKVYGLLDASLNESEFYKKVFSEILPDFN